MDSILFYQPASDPTSDAKGRFQGCMPKISVTQSAVSHMKARTEPRKPTTPFLRTSQSETHRVNMAETESQPSIIQPSSESLACDLGISFSMKDNAIAGRDYDELPYIYDLFKAYEHIRECSNCAAIASHDAAEDPRTKLIIAQKLRDKRSPQLLNPASALVNQERTKNSEEIEKPGMDARLGDNHDSPIIVSNDDDDDEGENDDRISNDNNDQIDARPGDSQDDPMIISDNDDSRSYDRLDNGDNNDDQIDGISKEGSPEAVSGGFSPTREDTPQTQKEVREGAEQPFSDSLQSTEAGQELEDETAELRATPQSSVLSKAKPFKGYEKYASPSVVAPSASLSQSAAEYDYVRRLSREQRDQYTPFLSKKLDIHVERQQTVLNRPYGQSSGASELQTVASIEIESHSLSVPSISTTAGIQASENSDEPGSSTEPATPCFCEGGPGDCGAQQHKSIEQRSFRQPSVNSDAPRVSSSNELSAERSRATSESSSQPVPASPQRERSRGAPEPSPSPDELRHSSVDMSSQRSASSRKRSHPVAEDEPSPKRSRRTRNETWKVREAREMAVILDTFD